jgi:type VI secretion system secreted protein Hcp
VADPVYLFLKVNGVTVEGDSTETSLGRQNSIECLYYRQGVALPTTSYGLTSGRRTYEPLVIRKRVDRSSPLLANALTGNRRVDGVFKFFRLSPSGDGTMEHYYTTEITQGRIVAVTQFVTDVEDPGKLPDQPFEEIAFVFNEIRWTWTISGVTSTDQVGGFNGVGFTSGSTAAGSSAGAAAGAGSTAAGSAVPAARSNGAGAAAAGSPAAAWPATGGAAPPVAAPEPLRNVSEPLRRSRVAAIVPLTEAEGSAGLVEPG